MKKIIILISLINFSFCYSQDWKLLHESPELGTYYYKPNNYQTAWIKIISEKTEYYPSKTTANKKTVDGYKIVLWKFDCRDRKIGVIKSTTYSKDGTVLESYNKNEVLVDMDYVNPDSIGESLLNNFCLKE
jgi:hypothetical protein